MYSTAIYQNQGAIARVQKLINKVVYRLHRTVLKKGRRARLMKEAEARFSSRFDFVLPQDPDMFAPDFLDLENLADQILTLRPKRVLEMGGGFSTLVIAQALDQVSRATGVPFEFVTIDQSPQYLEKTRAMMPAGLADKVTFLHDRLYVADRDGTLMSFFTSLPEGPFDFVYEDRCDHPDTPVAGDLLLLEQRAIDAKTPFSFTIDLMIATAQVCKTSLQRQYRVSGEYRTGTNFTQIK